MPTPAPDNAPNPEPIVRTGPAPSLFAVDSPTDQRLPTASEHPADQDGSLVTPDFTIDELRQLMIDAGAPAEYLAIADEFGDDVAGLSEWLLNQRVTGDSADLVGDILADWAVLLKRGTTALEAELCGAEFLHLFQQAAPDPTGPLAAMLEEVADSDLPAALVFARVMAHLGPPEVYPAATAAAHRLATAGVKDPPWVRSLGKPVFYCAFGYRDPLSSQESVAIGFRYGKRSHACIVLIDHRLGGGIKDVWFSDDADDVRRKIEIGSTAEGLMFADYSPWDAAHILEAAVTAPPCPADPDQIDDVATYLPLLLHRVALIPRERGASV